MSGLVQEKKNLEMRTEEQWRARKPNFFECSVLNMHLVNKLRLVYSVYHLQSKITFLGLNSVALPLQIMF